MQSRRYFLECLASGLAVSTADFDEDRLLWVPKQKAISIPAPKKVITDWWTGALTISNALHMKLPNILSGDLFASSKAKWRQTAAWPPQWERC